MMLVDVKEGEESSQGKDSCSPHEESERSVTVRIDGGLVAWLQVLGAFCLSFTTM